MRLSCYFEDLAKAYEAEIEDMQSDSEGKNVLSARLKDKRRQFALLMPMIETNPEMVAVAFHGGMRFSNPHAMALLSSNEPDEFPSWEEIAGAVQMDTQLQPLAETVLRESGGECFMITAACLEYLYGASHAKFATAKAADDDGHGRDDEERDDHDRDDEDSDGHDLEEAGADWLAEQGFDRRD